MDTKSKRSQGVRKNRKTAKKKKGPEEHPMRYGKKVLGSQKGERRAIGIWGKWKKKG